MADDGSNSETRDREHTRRQMPDIHTLLRYLAAAEAKLAGETFRQLQCELHESKICVANALAIMENVKDDAAYHIFGRIVHGIIVPSFLKAFYRARFAHRPFSCRFLVSDQYTLVLDTRFFSGRGAPCWQSGLLDDYSSNDGDSGIMMEEVD